MSALNCWLVLLSAPAIVTVVVSPVDLWWNVKSGGKESPMPPYVARKAALSRRIIGPARDALLIIVVLLLMRHFSFFKVAGLSQSHWVPGLLVGCAAAAAAVGFQRAISRALHSPYWPRAEEDYGYHRSLLFWVPSFLSGAFAEEVWRAFSIVALITVGYSISVAVLVSAVVFGLAHLGQGLGGAEAKVTTGLFWGVLYVWTGSLIAPFLAHSACNLHVLYVKHRSDAVAANRVSD